MSELNKKIIEIRVALQNSKIKKSGENKFAKFKYYELSDFLPKLNELMLEKGINDIFTLNKEEAKLTLIFGEEKQDYSIPMIEYETPKGMQEIQYLGALNTYYKRYLYLNAFGITDGEVIDSIDNSKITTTKKIDLVKEAQNKLKNKIKELNFTKEDKLKFYAENNITSKSTIKELEEAILKLGGNDDK